MFDFLEDILTESDLNDLREIINFSLSPQIKLEDLQEKIALSNFLQVKLTKILLKLKLVYADLEVEFDAWFSKQFHVVIEEYDGMPELLKNTKDYEREIKMMDEYKVTKSIMRKLEQVISSLQSKEKEFSAFDWKIKSIIDIHKITHNIMY